MACEGQTWVPVLLLAHSAHSLHSLTHSRLGNSPEHQGCAGHWVSSHKWDRCDRRLHGALCDKHQRCPKHLGRLERYRIEEIGFLPPKGSIQLGRSCLGCPSEGGHPSFTDGLVSQFHGVEKHGLGGGSHRAGSEFSAFTSR